MNTASLPPALSENDEISELIELLHRTEQRLHKLTAGEVDTVANRQGRTLLLSHAQEHRRQHEAARQASIVDALPMHIALLDARGIVVSVNDAWRAFADSNCMSDDGWGVGVSYLRVCDAACGANADGAQHVGTGIRAVLSGERDRFSIEYPCHAPDQQRWFLMTVTPLPGDPPTGVVVVHVNISERIQAEEAQRALQQLLTDVVENMPTAVQLKSVKDDFRILIWNKAAETMFGVSRDAAIGRNVHDIWPGQEGEHMYAADVELASRAIMQDFPDHVISSRDRGPIHAHVRKVALRDERGTLSHILVVADDMTIQRAA